ncbi:hypothetical protein [Opitutus sp. ER46]|uniref:hypothetical protein n=1 Tax=Opitutus sp. ER46 TaxID=2161864 RepID=UPI000D2FFFC8|nr:hypothetical protein [Opitutus sp. ER46]PTX97984.1 hypothetical protein DB354_05880 [Opitutus sp. ER46]
MSAIDEGIVREYFEQNGFLVRQARKYQVQARRKAADEEIDLIVYNPAWQRGARKPDFFLFSNELAYVHKAVISVKPWHTGVFTPAVLKGSPEVFRFLEDTVVKQVARFFPADTPEDPAGDLTKILVLPSLPTAEPFRSQSVEMLKTRGVDAIISFRAMLLDLIEKIEINQNYAKSDTLQVMRILKNYDLLKDTQLDLPGARDLGGRKGR